MSKESISQPAASTAVPAAVLPVPQAADSGADSELDEAIVVEGSIPDWCNLGLMLRVVVAVNVLFFCVASLGASSLAQWAEQWLRLAMVVEPVLLASLLFGCLIRRVTWRWPAGLQVAIALLLPAALTLGTQRVMAVAIDAPSIALWRDPLFALLIAATLLYWGRLRDRAYSPALVQAQLQALQSRIRPHFLFNSLNAALGLIRTDPRRAETVLEDIADLFRVLMRDSRERVPLSNEIDLCKQYLAIEQLRLGDRLVTRWQVDEASLPALVPTLLLQPLIENAVHHGIEPSTDPGSIEITIARNGRYIDIAITNPWQGEAVAARTRGNRIGLDNVRQRLALVHDLEATLAAGVRDDRYVVELHFPAERRRAPRGARPA